VKVSEDVSFDRACALVQSALDPPVRRTVVAEASRRENLGEALRRLGEAMRTDVWHARDVTVNLARTIEAFDRRTRDEGFHALHDWDGESDAVNPETIPVDVLEFVARLRGTGRAEPAVVAILLDYYLFHLLALLSLRVWDEGDADANLDRLDGLLAELQGEAGSGQRFAANAETLVLIATSHFEPREDGYALLLERVRTLNAPHRLNVALGHAASMGCHLRFGFEATYARDIGAMRTDNAADYPWLCFSLATLMRGYPSAVADDPSRRLLAEALLNGLSSDVTAFTSTRTPASLAVHDRERAEVAAGIEEHRTALLESFDVYRPSEGAYSPLSFFFNFSHNVVKGTIVDALLRERPWPLSLNDLLTSASRDPAEDESKVALANTLMWYARSNPDRIRGRLMPVIVYDPAAGRRAFGAALRALREPAKRV
jgi:hypothetical protein